MKPYGDLAVVLPCLGMQPALLRLLRAIPPHVSVYVVDDGSPVPLEAPGARVLRHATNRGYGAAQKTGYAAALEDGARRIVLLHGDGQYDPVDTLKLADHLDQADVVLGSRFVGRSPTNAPTWRLAGIKTLTTMANLRFGTRHTDLHNGARAFSARTLSSLPLASFSDDYHFDHQVVTAVLALGFKVVDRPVGMAYGPQVLSISFRRALRYGAGCMVDLILGAPSGEVREAPRARDRAPSP